MDQSQFIGTRQGPRWRKSANEMFVMVRMEARPKEMIGVEHSGEVQGWLNREELVI
jgi:hypothetical protein